MPYELDGDLVYDVERIIDHRYVRNGRGPYKLQYLVKWEAYGPEHDSWEPEVNLRDAPESLSNYAEYLQLTGQEIKPPAKAAQHLRPAPASAAATGSLPGTNARKRRRGERGGAAKKANANGGKHTDTAPSGPGPSAVDVPSSIAADDAAPRQTDASDRPPKRRSTRFVRGARQDQSRGSDAWPQA